MRALSIVAAIGGAAVLAVSPAGSSASTPSKDSGSDHHHHHHQHAPADVAPEPPPDDRDRERILRMQSALRDIIRGGALSRTRVGVRVVEARTGRLFYSQRDGTLMDPA